MDFEAINEKVGGCGLYHYIVFFLLASPTFKQAVDLQGLTFALYVPKFWCDRSAIQGTNTSSFYGNFTGSISRDQCSYRMTNDTAWNPCKKWIYDRKTFQSSMITEFDLVCSKASYKDLIYTFHFVGELVGYPIAITSDKIGRRFILLFFLYLSIPITIIQVYSYNLWTLIFATIFSGATKSVYIGMAYTTLIELMPIERIDIAATNFYIFYSVGYMSTAAFAYFGRTWRMIYLCSIIPTIIYIFYLCFVPETPRWLMLKGKKEQSFKTMSFIARINSRVLLREDFDKWHPIEEETGRIWSLFRYKRMIGRWLILTFAAWSFSFAYIGSSTDLTFASNNIFLTTLVMGMVEMPTGPLAALVARSMTRKKGVMSLCSLGIICLVTMPFFQSDPSKSAWQPWLKVILAMGGKLGFTSAWCVFDVITNELIPTTIRNGGMSLIYTSVAMGSIVAPIVHDVATEWNPAAPCLIYSCLLIGTVILFMVFLPETKNLPLPQTIEEAAALKKNKEQEWKRQMIEAANSRGNSDIDEIKL